MFESEPPQLTLATSVIRLSDAAVTLTVNISVTPPDAIDVTVQETIPVPPADGALQVVEVGIVTLLKVVPVGTVSLILAPTAWSGPLSGRTVV